jgi:hypothetical protein
MPELKKYEARKEKLKSELNEGVAWPELPNVLS